MDRGFSWRSWKSGCFLRVKLIKSIYTKRWQKWLWGAGDRHFIMAGLVILTHLKGRGRYKSKMEYVAGALCVLPQQCPAATVNTMVNAWLCQLWYLYWFTTVALGLSRHQNPWEGLLKSRSLGLPSFPYSSIGIVVGVGAQELDISHKIPADIATAGPGLPLWGPLAQVAVSLMMLCQSPKR